MKSVGFREVGIYAKHGQLDGIGAIASPWRNCCNGCAIILEHNLMPGHRPLFYSQKCETWTECAKGGCSQSFVAFD